ncbi:MAG: thioredoxin family protein [Desulfosarcina sp.]|nr:thioredoxin family protein [Desulfobacterales bacterium]
MYKRKIGLAVGILVLAGFFFGLQQPAFSSGKQINWYTYEEGVDQARRQNKNMVIYFHAEWCAYCTQMEKETFTDAAVIGFLNTNAVAVKVDVDREKQIARKYGVRGLPATFLMLVDGHQVGPLPGFIPPRSYLAMLSKIFSQS